MYKKNRTGATLKSSFDMSCFSATESSALTLSSLKTMGSSSTEWVGIFSVSMSVEFISIPVSAIILTFLSRKDAQVHNVGNG